MTHAQSDYWFRPKRYGYGAEPSNWKGWLASGLYLVVVAAITWPLIIAPSLAGVEPPVSDVIMWGVMLLAVTLAFVWLCRIKSSGVWRWRWGTPD